MPRVRSVSKGEKRKPGPPLPREWETAYLERIKQHGLYYLAAEEVGVSSKTVQRRRADDPAFNEACLLAREHAADRIAQKLSKQAEESGNPVGHIVRLKQLRPAEFVEQHVVKTLSMNVSVSADGDSALGQAVLAQLLQHASPETLASVAPPAALEAHPVSQDSRDG